MSIFKKMFTPEKEPAPSILEPKVQKPIEKEEELYNFNFEGWKPAAVGDTFILINKYRGAAGYINYYDPCLNAEEGDEFILIDFSKNNFKLNHLKTNGVFESEGITPGGNLSNSAIYRWFAPEAEAHRYKNYMGEPPVEFKVRRLLNRPEYSIWVRSQTHPLYREWQAIKQQTKNEEIYLFDDEADANIVIEYLKTKKETKPFLYNPRFSRVWLDI